jgi:hypothetical protein
MKTDSQKNHSDRDNLQDKATPDREILRNKII